MQRNLNLLAFFMLVPGSCCDNAGDSEAGGEAGDEAADGEDDDPADDEAADGEDNCNMQTTT